MDPIISKYFPYIFPFVFVGMWLAVTTILAVKAGWFELMRRYPIRDERPILKLRFQSRKMNGVFMSGILRLETCCSGLLVGIWRFFGPFSRDFFIPWVEIRAEKRNYFLWKRTALTFGGGPENLMLYDYTANRLAWSVADHWPEKGPFTPENAGHAAFAALKTAVVVVAFFFAFFTFAPLIFGQKPAAELYFSRLDIGGNCRRYRI